MPKISVITVNYNNAHGLKETISSVLSQTFTDYEYLIIDGESTDESKNLIEAVKDKLAYWVSEKDTGIYNAMNKGIKKAEGEYLLFLNSGDYLSNETVLSEMFDFEDSDADLIYGNLERTFLDGYKDVVKMPENLSVDFMVNSVLCHPVTFIKRKLFLEYGLYDESLKIISDWAFFLKVVVLKNASWLYKDVNVSIFSMDGLSSKKENFPLIQKETQIVLQKYFSKSLNELLVENKKLKEENIKLKERKDLEFRLKQIRSFLGIKKRQFFYFSNLVFKRGVLQQILNPKKIPIIINSFNRLASLRILIEKLTLLGYRNIIILDNNSTYPPLLEYYEKTNFKVIYLKKNYGHLALWDSGLIKDFDNKFYVYTDPDIIPIEECPSDFVIKFLKVMLQHVKYQKVGFSLKIDDLPNHYKYKYKVRNWEAKYWLTKIDKINYIADIDTTFALYSPFFTTQKFGTLSFFQALRTGGKYTAKHLPWYSDSKNLTDEDIFYSNAVNDSASWIKLAPDNY